MRGERLVVVERFLHRTTWPPLADLRGLLFWEKKNPPGGWPKAAHTSWPLIRGPASRSVFCYESFLSCAPFQSGALWQVPASRFQRLVGALTLCWFSFRGNEFSIRPKKQRWQLAALGLLFHCILHNNVLLLIRLDATNRIRLTG
jgi:hypothetical protein